MKIKQLWIRMSLLWVVCLGIPTHVFAQSATAILDQAAAAYASANGIQVSFNMLTKTPTHPAGEAFEGSIQMKGEKFLLVTPGIRTWFDGTTQWSYVERNEEVNVTTPSGDELRFTNPMVLLGSYQKGFQATYQGESTAASGKTVYDIVLTPKKKSDITKVELAIEKFSSLPASISVSSKNGVSTTIQISKIQKGVNQADGIFVFNEADYPDAEVIDLR